MRELIHDGMPFVGSQSSLFVPSRRRLWNAVAQRAVRPVMRGVYVDARVPDVRDLRARGLALVKPPRAVFYGNTAAWLMGVDTFRPRDRFDFVPQCVVPHGTGRCTSRLVTCHEGYLPPCDVMEIDGLLVTTPVRTASDLLRTMYRPHALAAADALAHAGLITVDEVVEHIARLKGFPGVVQGRYLAPLIEPGAASNGESWQRLRLIDAGFPRPQVQIPVFDRDGVVIALVDMGYLELLIGIEYDGALDHTSDEDRAHDQRRRTGLADRFGWRFSIGRNSNIWGDDPAFERQVGAWLGIEPLPRSW